MLYTYATTRPLRILYFDGISEVNADVQDILLYDTLTERNDTNDTERGQALCEWGKGFGIDGFVRQNPTLEVGHFRR